MRELMYGYDHAIHHLALIRIGFESVHTIQLPSYFGVARSTLSFHKKKKNGGFLRIIDGAGWQ